MPKRAVDRPSGGKGKRSNYKSVTIRVPLPLKGEVMELITQFHRDNEKYLLLPVEGEWWEVLGVSPHATVDEVREAYRELAKRYHPDTNLRLDAHARSAVLNQAYEDFKRQHRSQL
jgi:hypothetical protein